MTGVSQIEAITSNSGVFANCHYYQIADLFFVALTGPTSGTTASKRVHITTSSGEVVRTPQAPAPYNRALSASPGVVPPTHATPIKPIVKRSSTFGTPGTDNECWFVARHAEAVVSFCGACAMNSRDFRPLEIPEWMFDSNLCARMKPAEMPEEASQRAAARLREKSSPEAASVNAALARSLAQLHVKRRHR